jgi:antitoxin component of MazEF toxin-antitoxin module
MPNITKRSLFRIGDGGLALTIPKTWWTYYHLQPGDKVDVISNDELVVRLPSTRWPLSKENVENRDTT